MTFGILNIMDKNKSLFDDDSSAPPHPPLTKGGQGGVKVGGGSESTRTEGISDKKEVTPLERLKNLEDKIANAIEKVKTLKEDKAALERRIKELESKLDDKDYEIEKLQSEKAAIKSQVEGLLNELDTLEVS